MRHYGQIVKYVGETPWAILPSKLMAILDVVRLRADGVVFSEEEVQERIGAARPRATLAPTQGAVGVIPLYGVIVPKANLMSNISGGTSVEQFCSDLAEMVGDDRITSIVLDIDSPGGSVDQIPEAAAMIRAAKAVKQIVAVANTDAASAAYWLASQADEVVCTPSGQVGSIGVFCAHDDISGMQQIAGIKTTLISAAIGPYKTEGNPFEPLSEDAKAAMQDTVDQYGQQFLRDIAAGRQVPVKQVAENYGGGRMLTAKDALAAGMVDRVETLGQTISRLSGGKASAKPRKRRAEALELVPAAQFAAGGTFTFSDVCVSDVSDVAVAQLVEIAQAARAQGFEPVYAYFGDDATPVIEFIPTAEASQLDLDEGDEIAPVETAPPATPEATALHETKGSATPASVTAGKEQDAMRSTATDKIVARQDEIRERQQELDVEYAGRMMEPAARDEFDASEGEWQQLETTRLDILDRERKLAKKAAAATATVVDGRPHGESGFEADFNVTTRPDNIWDLASYRSRAGSMDDLVRLYRDGAKRALDVAEFPNEDVKRADAQTKIEKLLVRDTIDAELSRRMIVTGSEQYRRAWVKKATGQTVTAMEQNALDMFALTIGTPADGGFAIPYTLDPTIILSSNGAVNPIRSLARSAQITGHQWLGVTSAGTVASYGPEKMAAVDGSPVLAQPTAEVEKAQSFMPLSIEVSQDWVGVEAELARLFADAKDVLEADKFFNGLGHASHEPEGIVHALIAAGGSSIVLSEHVNLFSRDDLYSVEDALAPRFEPNAQSVANRAFYNAVRSATDDTFNIYVPIQQGTGRDMGGNTGSQLLGYPAWRASGMSKAITVGGEVVWILGDWDQFLLIDRIGMSVEFIPHLFDTGTGYPTGTRGLYAYWRNTTKLLVANAFRALRLQTT